MASTHEMASMTRAQLHGLNGKDKRDNTTSGLKEVIYKRDLTICVELEGEDAVTPMELMKCTRELCGGLVACRYIGANRYEITMNHAKGKERLLDGFKIGNVRVMTKELCNDELVVSFLGLSAYTTDEEILEKLCGWGVKAVSPIRRRMWLAPRSLTAPVL